MFGQDAKSSVLSPANPFREQTENDRKELAEKQEKLKERARQAFNEAEKCFKHPDFIKYRQNYEKLEKQSIDFLISYTKKGTYTLESYAFVVKSIVQDIAHYRQFIEAVKTDHEKAERAAENAG